VHGYGLGGKESTALGHLYIAYIAPFTILKRYVTISPLDNKNNNEKHDEK
jgi:hypothetical protein